MLCSFNHKSRRLWAVSKSLAGVFCDFFTYPCSKAISPFRTVKKTLAIRPPLKLLRTSHKLASILRTSGSPSGQRNCTSLMSSPIVLRSSLSSSFNQSQTNSRPAGDRKKITRRIRSSFMKPSVPHVVHLVKLYEF